MKRTSLTASIALATFLFVSIVSHAAVFTVTTANDSGVGSLRWAIQQAEANAPLNDTINFNIPAGGGVATIALLTPLPPLWDPLGVTIDGFSQPGASAGTNPPSTATLRVRLDGSAIVPPLVPIAPTNYAHGLWIRSSHNDIRGLVVHSFPHDGICIQASTPYQGAFNNRVYCCFSGTDPSGTQDWGNGWHNGFPGGGDLWAGIYIVLVPGSPGQAHNNVIENNLCSGNWAEGIGISSCPSDGDVSFNIVRHNLVGTRISGQAPTPIPNDHDGIYLGEGTHDNVVESNTICGNHFEGVCIVGYAEAGIFTDRNIIRNNRIGVDASLSPMGNARHGVSIGAYGTQYYGGYAQYNSISNNVIACNGRNGVMVWEHWLNNWANADYNTISQNAIYYNGYTDPGYLGIDLQEDGLTANDPGDTDVGPNQWVNYPVINSVSFSLGAATISGYVQIDTSPGLARVEVFRALPDLSGKNHGQAQAYIGTATPNGAGNWSLAVFGAVYPGDYVTATTTDTYGNTSEFAANTLVPGEPNWDFGDAPEPPYPTKRATAPFSADGARHWINPVLRLGSLIDSENDGQPHPQALGDDSAGVMDEDGLLFTDPFIPGQQTAVRVTAAGNGFLNAWADFNRDGVWSAAEQIAVSQPLTSGVNRLVFTVPASTVSMTNVFARFRYSSLAALAPTGPAPDGEVEDVWMAIDQAVAMDFGDAPDGPYPTLFASDGARHVLSSPSFCLGTQADGEFEAQPNASASGDDAAGSPDEDGVTFPSQMFAGEAVTVSVVMTGSEMAILDAWLDFDNDASWAQPADHCITAQNVLPGTNAFTFNIPATAASGTNFARFRLSKLIGLSYTGVCTGGEVEDYTVRILPKRPVVSISVGTKNCVLTWSAYPGALHYEVYCTTDLTQPFPSGWTNLTPAGITATTWQEPIVSGPRFYRIRVVLP